MRFARSAALLSAAIFCVACQRRPPEGGAPPAVASLDSAVSAEEQAAVEQLPPADGRILVLGACLICHGASLIIQQHKDSTAWARSVAQMVAWGAPLAAEQQAALVRYLAEHYPPKAGGP